MSAAVFQIESAVAGLAILASGFIIFPRGGINGLAKSLAATILLGVIAALLIATARSFGP